MLAALALAAPVAAQDDPAAGDRSVLVILDGSDSMNEQAGDGGTRLDAAKSALRELIDVVPEGAQVGLRVYGNKLSGVARAKACRDTTLVTPVGPLDKDQFRSEVDSLEGKGRTPIGRSLLKAPDDLGPSGDRTVILVSDGGDNCAPPQPCPAARQIAERGLKLSISVVGLQVDDRVRRQLECIAKAGGGTYVDAQDPEALKRELLAAFARAFRAYEATGTPVQGTPEAASAPTIGEGQFLDEIRPGEIKTYAVDVKPGQKLFASAVAVPPRSTEGAAPFYGRLITPRGRELPEEGNVLDYQFLGQYGNIIELGMKGPQTAAPGIESEAEPGRWIVQLRLETGDLEPEPVPVELGIQVLDPNEAAGQAKEPGASGTPEPTASATPRAEPRTEDDDDGGGSGLALVIPGVVGLAIGLLGGFVAVRRRRS
ncbi:MAG TPA: VWA domain-containing protein [Solirubrobacteraceae bacterium]|nr:VWA domain-containing protein [Solirubrobacteraceae bacterium]